MEIKGMRRIDGTSKVKAFFSVEFPGKLTINDCKLIEGKNGLFAGMPSKKYTDRNGQEKYQSIVYCEQDLLNKISVAAELEYHGLTTKPNTQAPDEDIPFLGPEMFGPLIPVPKPRKGPTLEGWNTMTPEQLEQEVLRTNGCNLALRLDHYASIDPDSLAARKIVDQWEAEGHLPRTIAWRTASGAIRRLFKAPAGLKRMQIPELKLDLRHGSGFCDLIPPSFVIDKSKGLRGSYEWLPEQSPEDIDAAELPSLVVSFFIKHLKEPSTLDTLDSKTHAKIHLLEEGHRDEGLYHVALNLFKGGSDYQEVDYIIKHLANSCNPPFNQSDAARKVESAYKRFLIKDRKITQEVREWVMASNGLFMTQDVHKELDLASRDLKKQANEAIRRMELEGILGRYGKKRGCYRLIEGESESIDIEAADISTTFPIRWPFDLQNYVDLYPKSIVVVAGSPNAGKTAFMLNVVRLNMDIHKIYYFSSEMGAEEFKLRLLKFADVQIKDWRFFPKRRSANFADAIVPNAVNIIDYLEITDEFFKVGGDIKEIYDRLGKGIAIIAMQKKTGSQDARGGEFTREKARLYISIESGVLKIIKAKLWANSEINPDGLTVKFKLVGGAKFIETGGSLYDLM